MRWITANAFPIVIFIAFIAMHVFGHGGHGGHGGHSGHSGHAASDPRRHLEDGDTDGAQRRVESPSSGTHQH